MSVATINWNGVAGSTPDTNSCMITYAAADTLYDTVNAQTFPAGAVSTALDTFLTNHGWSRVTATSGTISTTAGMYAYKAANLNDANGVGSYKYMLLDFRTSGKIYCKVYETIGTDSTLTNLAYGSDTFHGTVSAHTSGSTTYAGKLWISASARHFVMQSYSNGVYGNQSGTTLLGPVGCFEHTRTHPLDLATGTYAYPKYSSFQGGNSGNAYNIHFALTRAYYGSGINAYSQLCTLYRDALPSNAALVAPDFKIVATPVALSSGYTSQAYRLVGCVFNMCMLSNYAYGIVGDDVNIPVTADSNFGNEKFYDPAGTFTSFWVLGNTSGNRYAVPK